MRAGRTSTGPAAAAGGSSGAGAHPADALQPASLGREPRRPAFQAAAHGLDPEAVRVWASLRPHPHVHLPPIFTAALPRPPRPRSEAAGAGAGESAGDEDGGGSGRGGTNEADSDSDGGGEGDRRFGGGMISVFADLAAAAGGVWVPLDALLSAGAARRRPSPSLSLPTAMQPCSRFGLLCMPARVASRGLHAHLGRAFFNMLPPQAAPKQRRRTGRIGGSGCCTLPSRQAPPSGGWG